MDDIRRPIALAVMIFSIAFLLRVGITARFEGLRAPPDWGANPDQVDYELFAHRLRMGQGYSWSNGKPTAARAPGTSFTLLPVYLFGRSFLAGRLWFCCLSALTCVVTAWIGYRAFGSWVGFLSGMGLALYPGHFYYSMHFLSEVPYGLWLTLAVAGSSLAMERRRLHWDLLAGAVWGLAALTRPQILLGIPFAWLFGVLSGSNKRYLRPVAIQTLVCMFVVVPWMVRNKLVIGTASLSTAASLTFWGAHNQQVFDDPTLRGGWTRTSDLVDLEHPLTGTEAERAIARWRYGFAFCKENLSHMPALWLAKMWRLLSPWQETSNLVVLWAFAIGWILCAPLVLLGLPLAFYKNREATLLMIVPLLATVATATIFYGSVRFRDSASPIFVILAAVSLVEILRTRQIKPKK